jgi:phenylalanine-4-hydroxylase
MPSATNGRHSSDSLRRTKRITLPSQMCFMTSSITCHSCLNLPLLNFLQWYGEQASNADDEVLKKLARLYWYTIEYGLIQEGDAIKAFGAGLPTSRAESSHSIKCIEKHRTFQSERISVTEYVIDAFQTEYYVLKRLEDLLRLKINLRL